MKKIFLLCCILFSGSVILAQLPDSAYILLLNQQIDAYVVSQNLAALDTLYGDDFVFAHGSGRVEGKAGWMKTVSRTRYPMRQHDSVTVERHPGLALVKGRLSIGRIDKEKTTRYYLRYIRLFALREKGWQLISHHTVDEHHL
ncbi:MAG: nuclear transport factor 2 family protein [Chitinophagaceae bacterium]